MVLSTNDEEVANSPIKHTQLKTTVHKPYPISDQNGRNWFPTSDQNGSIGAAYTYIAYIRDYSPPPGGGAKNANYASETKKWLISNIKNEWK